MEGRFPSDGRRSERRPRSWTARVVAPIAIVVVAGAIVMVVGASPLSSSDDSDDAEKGDRTTVETCQPAADNAVREGYYVIQQDDPGLSAVADKTCIPVERLERLNDNLDPQLIPVGACVDLRRDGCKVLANEG